MATTKNATQTFNFEKGIYEATVQMLKEPHTLIINRNYAGQEMTSRCLSSYLILIITDVIIIIASAFQMR